MKSILQFFSLASLAFAVPFMAEEQVNFSTDRSVSQNLDCKVVRCFMDSVETVQALVSQLEAKEFDIWQDRGFEEETGQHFIDVRLESHNNCEDNLALAISRVSAGGASVYCQDLISDVSSLIQQVQEQQDLAALNEDSEFFARYHSYEELYGHVKELAESHPSIARFVPSIGKTWEQRDIAVVHITAPNNQLNKKTIWINGGIHAREWISSHTAVYLIEQLITGYGVDAEVTRMLEQLEFVISPHINPDGYEYSRLSYRLWRKNRRANDDGSMGVDLNRNYDVHWDGTGSSTNPRADTYRGPSAGSEPEVQACMKYIKSLKNAIIGIDLHSYGQLLLRPYGFGRQRHPTEPLNKELGDGMRQVIIDTSGRRYTSERSVDLYPASGGMDDWISISGLIGFTIELRDTGIHGFVLPPDQILPTGQEIWAAIKFMGNFAIEKIPVPSQQ